MWNSQKSLLITEGVTDCAAALDLEFPNCIGRPSCSGGVYQIKELINRLHFRNVVIICDNDDPGICGAKLLSDSIGTPSCLICLPVKDIREFKIAGGDRQLLDSLINQSIWHNP